jgi:hypothetical protein
MLNYDHELVNTFVRECRAMQSPELHAGWLDRTQVLEKRVASLLVLNARESSIAETTALYSSALDDVHEGVRWWGIFFLTDFLFGMRPLIPVTLADNQNHFCLLLQRESHSVLRPLTLLPRALLRDSLVIASCSAVLTTSTSSIYAKTHAAGALGNIYTRESIEVLDRLWRSDDDERIRVLAAVHLIIHGVAGYESYLEMHLAASSRLSSIAAIGLAAAGNRAGLLFVKALVDAPGAADNPLLKRFVGPLLHCGRATDSWLPDLSGLITQRLNPE